MTYDNYFEEKHYVNSQDAEMFDVVFDENNCSSFRSKGEVCDNCFNAALLSKMQEFNSLQRLKFINYQLNKYSNPLDWLERLYAFLQDNELEFPSHNYKMYQEYLSIARVGIKQLSNEEEPKKKTTPSFDFVNPERIEELKKISSSKFDLKKLESLCTELNICYNEKCYLAVMMLIRAIIDHVPPIFDSNNFQNLYSQYGTKSFKDHMEHLDKSSRKIADSYLHVQIRKKETLPNNTQVNFSQDLDVLLSEICRILG